MLKSAKRAAIWGDRLEVAKLEEIRARPLVAVRVTLVAHTSLRAVCAAPSKMAKPLLSRVQALDSLAMMKDAIAGTETSDEGF